MREIKFRAWDKRQKKMLKWGDIQICPIMTNPDSTVVYERHGDEWSANADLEALQYTGLKDRDGNEIYEGDILENDIAGKCVVEFRNVRKSGWRVSELVARMENGDFDYFHYNCEVIGNIYENPDPLKQ